jgi:hypothetical protein
MNTRPCCKVATGVRHKARTPASRLRRGGELAGWIMPGATLALLPKCPACVAAYLALFSGVGVSISTATYLRTSLLVLCVTSLLFVSLRRLCRVVAEDEPTARRSSVSDTKTISQHT